MAPINLFLQCSWLGNRKADDKNKERQPGRQADRQAARKVSRLAVRAFRQTCLLGSMSVYEI
jgi:hypothetical protein